MEIDFHGKPLREWKPPPDAPPARVLASHRSTPATPTAAPSDVHCPGIIKSEGRVWEGRGEEGRGGKGRGEKGRGWEGRGGTGAFPEQVSHPGM